MAIEIVCECDECGGGVLDKKIYCADCIDIKIDENYKEGKKDGYEEGYQQAEKDNNL